jgi:hypothetical protein
MHFFSAKKLSDRFKTGQVDEKQKFYYCVIFILVNFLGSLSLDPSRRPLGLATMGGLVLSLDGIRTILHYLVVLAGVTLSFRENRLGDNKQFLERFFCLSVPVFFQVLIILLGVYLLCMAVVYFDPSNRFRSWVALNSTMVKLWGGLVVDIFKNGMLIFYIRQTARITPVHSVAA